MQIEKLKLVLIIILCFIKINSSKAQECYFKNYNDENGLLSSNTYQVFQDSKSYVWIASSQGVTQYDGYEFKSFRQTLLSNKPIWQIIESKDQRIWFITFNGELFYFDNNQVFEYQFNSKIQSILENQNLESIIYFKIKAESNIFIGFENGKEVFITNQGVVKYRNLNLNSNVNFQVNINSINKNYKVWIKKSKLKNCRESHLIDYNSSKLLVLKNKIIAFDSLNTKIERYYKSDILWLSKSQKGELIVAFRRNGVIVYKDFFNNIISHHLLPSYSVSSFIEDSCSGVWISTLENGVYYYPNKHIKNLTVKEGLNHKKITTLCSSKEGIIIPTLTSSYQIFDLDTLKTYSIKSNTKFSRCTGVSYMDDKVFLGFHDKYRNEYAYILKKDSIIWKGNIDFINVFKQNNDYYILGTKRMYHLDNYKIKREARADDFTIIYSMYLTSDSTFLAATNSGLYNYNYEKFYYDKIPLSDYSINSVISKVEIYNSTILLATKLDGMISLKNEKLNYYNKDNFLISNSINDFILVDSTLWVASNNGVVSLNLNKKEQYVFNKNNGLLDNKVNHIEYYNNKLFFATDKGISYLDKNLKFKSFSIYIEKIYANDTLVKNTNNIKLDYKNNSLKFCFKALSYSSDIQKKYYYKLIGYDKKWKWTTNLFVDYVNLPKGNYQFIVKAIDSSKACSNKAIIKSIIVEEEIECIIWEIFKLLLYLSILVFIVYYIIKYRTNQLSKKLIIKNKINEYRQQALSAQMNPHFLYNSLNSIQSYIAHQDDEKAMKYLSKFGVLMRRVLNNSQHSKITLKEELEALKLYVEMELMRFHHNFNYEVNIAKDINLSLIYVPPLMVQPYVENAIHHGLREKKGEKRLLIDIYNEEDSLIIDIIDNGIGIEQSKQRKAESSLLLKSYGTSITEKRIKVFSKIYSSKYSIDTKDNKNNKGEAEGTKVQIKIKNYV